MINLILSWALFALSCMFVSWIIPGIEIEGFVQALVLAFVIGLLNVFLKPVLSFMTLPVNILTLGLFGVILNTFLFMLAGYFTKGVEIEGFIPALLGSLLLALFGNFIFKTQR